MISAMSEAALKMAVERADGPAALGRALKISSAAISQWKKVPALRVLDVERITGVPRHELRPDIYPPPEEAASEPETDGERAKPLRCLAPHGSDGFVTEGQSR